MIKSQSVSGPFHICAGHALSSSVSTNRATKGPKERTSNSVARADDNSDRELGQNDKAVVLEFATRRLFLRLFRDAMNMALKLILHS